MTLFLVRRAEVELVAGWRRIGLPDLAVAYPSGRLVKPFPG